MYLEFLLLITDYFRTVSKRIFFFEWLFPFLIGVGVFLLLFFGSSTSATIVFKDNAINLLGILVGFSITIITILTTGQGQNLDEIKNKKTKIKINKEKITLFRLLLINFTYSVIIEVGLIIGCLIYPLLIENIEFNENLKYVGFSILVFLILHIMLLTMRNLTDFYLILVKPTKKSQ
ncbi:hypothetical protein [Pontimicrobium aquaticum]|uniref:Uncharacterized protein n=1 Tax=Pontimicrobium aquaticum TaxID=2565367 RepID=A0A4U0EZX4_9FLAO|nr:hypothetical protein [Pontimicrobium aquaticum]TJY37691.1 hypothetical protein E5167_00100 [Pontimicrobium aquaticum]